VLLHAELFFVVLLQRTSAGLIACTKEYHACTKEYHDTLNSVVCAMCGTLDSAIVVPQLVPRQCACVCACPLLDLLRGLVLVHLTYLLTFFFFFYRVFYPLSKKARNSLDELYVTTRNVCATPKHNFQLCSVCWLQFELHCTCRHDQRSNLVSVLTV
jgi:hypothetical protein